MRTLVYKRTHNGDPDEETGTFGINGCMGTVRGFEYEAVIGVGGVGREPQGEGIAGKLTWIGIGPEKTGNGREPLVRFRHFWYRGPSGPKLRDVAPRLAERFRRYPAPRYLLDKVDAEELEEIHSLLQLAEKAPPSPGLMAEGRSTRVSCKPATVSARGNKNESHGGC